MNEGKILMVDDDEDVLLAVKMLLKKYNYQVIENQLAVGNWQLTKLMEVF